MRSINIYAAATSPLLTDHMNVCVCLFDRVNQSYLRLSAQDSRVLKVLSPPLWGDWDFLFKIGIVREKFIACINIVKGEDR